MIEPCWIGPGILRRCYRPRGPRADGPIVAPGGRSRKEALVATLNVVGLATELARLPDADLMDRVSTILTRINDTELDILVDEVLERFAPAAHWKHLAGEVGEEIETYRANWADHAEARCLARSVD
jgi:hypothetical protein